MLLLFVSALVNKMLLEYSIWMFFTGSGSHQDTWIRPEQDPDPAKAPGSGTYKNTWIRIRPEPDPRP